MSGPEIVAAGADALGRAAAEIAGAVLASAWVIFVLVYVLAATARRASSPSAPTCRPVRDGAPTNRGRLARPGRKGAVFRREAA